MEIAPRQLILSLYGLYAREDGDWLSVASLISLMADLGADSAAVRSSVSRLKRRGMLEAAQREGQPGYALSPSTLELLRQGDHRIWSRPRATAADGWLVLVFSVPESERDRRHALRSLLSGLGFGTAAPGVWVAPATLYDETRRALDRTGLMSYTEFFRGDYLGAGDVSTRMREWWDVDALTALYDEFCADWRPVDRKRSALPPAAGLRGLRPDAHLLAAAALPRPRAAARAPAPGLAGDRGGRPVRAPGWRLRDDAHTHAHGIVHG